MRPIIPSASELPKGRLKNSDKEQIETGNQGLSHTPENLVRHHAG